jgi:hypothetical protein
MYVPDPAPYAWEHLLDFDRPLCDVSSGAFLVDNNLDTGTGVPVLPAPTPVTAGEQLAAWLALANPDDIAQMISGGHAPVADSSGLDALGAYGTSMDAVLGRSPTDGVVLTERDTLGMWVQPPEENA